MIDGRGFPTVLGGWTDTDQGADALALGRALASVDGRVVVCCVYRLNHR